MYHTHMTRKPLISKMPWRYERVIIAIQRPKITKPPLISKRPCIYPQMVCMDDACGSDAYLGTPACDVALINEDVQSSVRTPWNTSDVAAPTGWQMVRLLSQ